MARIMNPRFRSVALGAALVAFLFLPNFVHAEITCSLNPLTWPTCIALAATAIVGIILGAVLVIAAWVLEVVLAINQNVVGAASVRVGFAVTLGLANLGFVFGIIVIAIATIIRYQTYGMKQILWKLVVMAVLINFSMTIAGTIIGFANDLTGYFMAQATPGGLAGSFGGFVKNFVAGLEPQKGTVPQVQFLSAGTELFTDPGAVVGVIASSYISILFGAITVIVLGATIVMLLVRYVALGILLVLMPIAWLCWVFPDLQSNWNRWWHSFLRWTFFAPLLMFFTYLALAAWTGRSEFAQKIAALKGNADSASRAFDSKSGVLAVIQGFFADISENVAQQMLVVGLMVGGIFAANSLGIMGASAAMGAATGVARGFGSYVGTRAGRLGLRGVSAPFRGERGGVAGAAERLAERLRGGGRLARVGGWLAGKAARPMVRLGGIGGEELVKQYEKEHGGRGINDLKNLLTTAGGAERIAVQKLLAGKGEFNLPQTHSAANQRLWAANNMGQLYKKEIETPSGLSAEFYQAKKAQAKGEKQIKLVSGELVSLTGEDGEKNIQGLLEKFLSGLTKADAAKMAVKDIMSTDPKGAMGESQQFVTMSIQPHFVRGMVNAASDHISSILPKLKGAQLGAFQEQAGGYIERQSEELINQIKRIGEAEGLEMEGLNRETIKTLTQEQKERLSQAGRQLISRHERLVSASKKLGDAIGANALFIEGGAAPSFQPPPTGVPKSPTTT